MNLIVRKITNNKLITKYYEDTVLNVEKYLNMINNNTYFLLLCEILLSIMMIKNSDIFERHLLAKTIN
jgi:hypothetical protein